MITGKNVQKLYIIFLLMNSFSTDALTALRKKIQEKAHTVK